MVLEFIPESICNWYESFDNIDVEVIVRPSCQKNRSRFDPSEFYGITDVPSEIIQKDTKDLREQWNRRI